LGYIDLLFVVGSLGAAMQDRWMFSASLGRFLLLPAAIGFLFPHSSAAQQARLAFDRNDPEITAFRTQRSAAPRALAPEEAAATSVRIPVLAFDAVPALVQRSLAPGETPRRERSLVTDPADPVWYSIEDDYGDITITVKADARIQHTFPEGHPLAPDAADASAPPRISVLEEASEPGMEGLIAEYTVYKFPNLPYTVTIECAPHLREQCRNLSLLAQDKDSLRLLAVPPE
jgi:hypothetical protein